MSLMLFGDPSYSQTRESSYSLNNFIILFADMKPRHRKSLLSNFMVAKDEFVSMKLHFRYHTYLYTKKGSGYDGCKYCQNKPVKRNSESATNKNKKSERV
jgi:hypothetical protein